MNKMASMMVAVMAGSFSACVAPAGEPPKENVAEGSAAVTLASYATWAQSHPLTVAMITTPRQRRDAAALSTTQKNAFVSALLSLKTVANPWGLRNWKTGELLSYYDAFAEWHVDLYRCGPNDGWSNDEGMGAHMNPLVLPWHREHMLLLENALRQASQDPNMAIPYWTWRDTSSGSAALAMLGGDGAASTHMVSAPFDSATWPITVFALNDADQSPALQRAVGTHPYFNDPQAWANITLVSTSTGYDTAPYNTTILTSSMTTSPSVRAALDGWRDVNPPGSACLPNQQPSGVSLMLPTTQPTSTSLNHVAGHSYIAGRWCEDQDGGVVDCDAPDASEKTGTMGIHASPNDPMFFLHHGYVDKLWWQWEVAHTMPQQLSGNGTIYRYRPFDNEPMYGASYGPSHALWPFRDPSYVSSITSPNSYPNSVTNDTTYADTTLPGITGAHATGPYVGYSSINVMPKDLLDNNHLVMAKDGAGNALVAVVQYL